MELFTKVMLVIFGVALALFLWLKDLAKNTTHIKWKKAVNVLIILSLSGTLIFGIWAVIIDAYKDKNKNIGNTDSIRIITAPPIHDTIGVPAKEEKRPLLNIFEGPRFQNRIADSIPIALSVKNYGKATAKKLYSSVISVDENGPSFTVTNIINSKTPNEKFITPDGVYAYYMNFDINKFNVSASTFIYFRVSYTDAFGTPSKDTIREVYQIPNPVSNAALIFDAKEAEFNRIKMFLLKSKLW